MTVSRYVIWTAFMLVTYGCGLSLLSIEPAWDGSRWSRVFGRPTFRTVAIRGPQPADLSVDVFVSRGGTFLYIPWHTDAERAISLKRVGVRFVSSANPTVELVGVYHAPIKSDNYLWRPYHYR